MSFLIRLEDVVKSYRIEHSEQKVLRGIHLSISRGEMTAIIGKSGSGKSTLMNVIGLLDRPTSGQYYFNDQVVSALSDDDLSTIRNQQIGFVFQSFFLLPRSNVIENVMLPLFYRGVKPDAAIEKAIALLDRLGLAEMKHKYPNQLSGGQQQRVAIARAMVGDPAILLADEPTGALDSKTGGQIMQLLHELNRDEGRTILIITHDQAISSQCRRVLTMRDGMLI